MDKVLHKQNSIIELMPKQLTVYQRKGFNAMLKIALKELKTNDKFDFSHDYFKISYKELKKLIGSNRSNVNIFNYLSSLLDLKVTYYTENQSGGFNILQNFTKNGDYINFQLTSNVYTKLKHADYTSLDLGEMSKLKHKYGVTLYEWFLRYRDFKPNGEYYNPKWELKELKEKLGIDKASYKTVAELKRAVIDKAIQDIKDHTCLKVSYELTREGSRKYTHIQLFLERPQIIEAKTVEKILICNNTQEVIDKILQTDLIHIKEKRVNRQQLEGAIKELNKQHNKQNLILAALKKLVKNNKQTVHPKNLKAYLWSIATNDVEEAPEKPHKSQTKKAEPAPIKATDDSSMKLEKIKVTQEEYEKLYEQHLKDNKIIHTKHTRSAFDISNSKKYEIISKLNQDNNSDDDYTPPRLPDNEMTWTDDQGRIVGKSFKSWEEEQEYKNVDFSRDNPKRTKELQNKADKKKKDERDRTLYMKYLKKIELDLILTNDSRLEDFKQNYMRFFQLYEFLSKEYFTPDEETLERANKEIDKLKTFFEQFEEKEEPVIDISEISEEKLLSKKGKRLFGGALISRLESIAKELKTKIKYKDKVIG